MKNRQLANVLGKGFPIATFVYLSSPHLLTNSFTGKTTVLNCKAKLRGSVKVWFHHPTAPRLHLWLGCTRLFGKGAMMSRHCFHGLFVGAIKTLRLSFNNSPNRKTSKKSSQDELPNSTSLDLSPVIPFTHHPHRTPCCCGPDKGKQRNCWAKLDPEG